jgi:hypothetical protein
MTDTMDHSAVAAAAIEQTLCPRRRITLLELTSNIKPSFPVLNLKKQRGHSRA